MEGENTIVKELPPGVSTEKFVTDIGKKFDVDCVKRGDTENVDLLVHTNKDLPLEKTFLTSNMHGFDSEGYLVKYDTVYDILSEYMRVGERIYEKSLAKKREDLTTFAREQKRRRDYIRLFCAPTETILYPLQVEQLSRLMVAKGWPDDVNDLLDSVKDREKTTAGAAKAESKASAAENEWREWSEKTWKDMWSSDLDAFVSCLTKLT